MNALLNLSAAFGLSGAAGLNAYIPLFILSLLANLGLIHLAPPFDVMGHGWCLAIFGVMSVVEIVVDKVPGADHVNDVIQTFIRPTAGAILFASQAGHIYGVHPGVWIVVGLLTSGGVHAVKSFARPVVNIGTVGLGAPVVSTVENAITVGMSLIALLAPVLVLVASGVVLFLAYRLVRQFRNRNRSAAQATSPLDTPSTPRPPRAARPAIQPLHVEVIVPRRSNFAQAWGGGM